MKDSFAMRTNEVKYAHVDDVSHRSIEEMSKEMELKTPEEREEARKELDIEITRRIAEQYKAGDIDSALLAGSKSLQERISDKQSLKTYDQIREEHQQDAAELIRVNALIAAGQTEAQKQERIDESLKIVGKHHSSCSFENYNIYHNSGTEEEIAKRRNALIYAIEYAEVIKRGEHCNAVFYGGYGTGKTYLAVSVFRELLNAGKNVRYLPVHQLIEWLRRAYKKNARLTRSEIIAKDFLTLDLLIIDDIGNSKGSDSERDELFELVNEMYRAERSILICSNFGDAGIEQFMGGAVYSRLSQENDIKIVFDWEDGR